MNNSDISTLQKKAVDFLTALIKIPRLSREENLSADFIFNFLKDNHVEPKEYLNNVWAVNHFFNASKPTILLNSHHDTVPPNKAYTNNPYHSFTSDGKLFGLGSTDAGGALSCLMTCFLFFNDKKHLPYNIVFAATAEEEVSGANGIESLFSVEQFKVLFEDSRSFGIVGEPTQLDLAVSEKGLMVLDGEAIGLAGHAARDEGENALYMALKDIEWFKTYDFPKISGTLGKMRMNVTSISTDNKAHNVVPASCKFVVDVRLTDAYTHEEVLDIIKENVSSSCIPRSTRLRSTSIPEDHPVVVAGKALGKKVYGSPTTSDKALIPMPCLKCGPGYSGQSHSADEFILLNDLHSGVVFILIYSPNYLNNHEAVEKKIEADKSVEKFTVGRDQEFDLLLAPFDVLGNMAHAQMLGSVGLLTQKEVNALQKELKLIYKEIQKNNFVIAPGVEDVHSQVEMMLTEKLGDTGKKIHSARSRNDQVLVDIKLFLRHEMKRLVLKTNAFFHLLIQQSEKFKNDLLPGYTHLQLAMPSSFGLWFGAYAESLTDDLETMLSAYKVINKNPLGSAAGYGSSFPINRTLTTKLLGFAALNHNVVYAQMGRGKTERITAQALANLADTLAKLSMDVTLFLNQNFNFISFPAAFTTGSSIMPHKKNPDVFEIIRGHCNRIKALPNEISMQTTNLPSGYHRELQLLKENLFPAFETLHRCMDMAKMLLEKIEVKKDILQDEKYKYLFSVEEVNKLVLQGIPFREAYRQVGNAIEDGNFTYQTSVKHVHEGSIGNLQNNQITKLKDVILKQFPFEKVQVALDALIGK